MECVLARFKSPIEIHCRVKDAYAEDVICLLLMDGKYNFMVASSAML